MHGACNRFEKEVKEVLALVDEQISAIDIQIKEVEQIKREEKRKAVQELFESIGFQKFVTLGMIWDEKWLNASVALSKVENQMKETMYRIGEEVGTISRLPEFSFEAMEVYKKALDLTQAIKKGQELADIQKRRKKRLPDRKLRKREEKQRKLLQEKSQRIRKKLRILMMCLKKPRRMTIQELFQNRL